MSKQNADQERSQFKSWLAKFWKDWKPHLTAITGTIIVAGVAVLVGYAAYWYTMAFGFWTSLLATLAAIAVGTSLTMVFGERLADWSTQRRLDKAEKERDKEPALKPSVMASPTAAPAT